jgi:hypothetical protein
MFGLHVLAAVAVPDDVAATVAGALGQPDLGQPGRQPMPAEFDCTGNDSYRTVWWSVVRSDIRANSNRSDLVSVECRRSCGVATGTRGAVADYD